MQDAKEILVQAFCILSLVITMLKILAMEIEDLKKRFRRK
jgi:hypothetical protein